MILSKLLIALISLHIILTMCMPAFSQNTSPFFINYSAELSSSEVYDIYQDSNGKIWIATDSGITLYDSKDFKFVDVISQTNSNVVFGFSEVTENEVWISTKDNELFKFDPSDYSLHFEPYQYNNNLRNSLSSLGFRAFISSFKFNKGELHVSFERSDKLIINKEGKCEFKFPFNRVLNNFELANLLIHSDSILPFTEFVQKTSNQTKILWKNNKGNNQTLINRPSHSLSKKYCSIIAYKKKENVEYFAVGRYLIQKTNNTFDHVSFETEILDFEFNGEDLIVGTFSGVYEVDSRLNITEHYLNQYSITSILRDRENGFWFGTLSKGVFYSPNLKMKVINNSEEIYSKNLFFYNNQLICSDNKFSLYVFSIQNDLKIYEDVYDKGNVYLSKNKRLTSVLGERHDYYDPEFSIYFHEKSQTTIYGYSKRIAIFHEDTYQDFRYDTISYITSSIMDSDSTAIIGTEESVLKYELGKGLENRGIRNYPISSPVREICKLKEKYVFLLNEGIVIESSKETFLIKKDIRSRNGFVNGFFKENDSTLWSYSNEGISKIIFSDLNFKVINYNEFENLPSTEITSFSINKDSIYVGTKKGISIILKENLNQHPVLDKSHFIIDSISLSNSPLVIRDTVYLSDAYQPMSIYYNYINYDKKDIKIDYLSDKSSNWIIADSKKLYLNEIGYGTHFITFRARFNNEILVLRTITIIVPTPLTSQAWFIPVLILCSCMLIFFFFRSYLIRKQKKENEMTKLEMDLLQSRMNPHFTFNTISSIQSYILKRETGPAIKYLSDFGLLMRRTLDYSHKNYIELGEELSFLKLLIELENRRFETNFILNLSLADNVPNFKLPSLILQPLVENVILHAQFDEGQEKNIYIKVNQDGHSYILEVEDHGMKKANSLKQESRQSFGIPIIRNRIKLHNGKKYQPNDFHETSNYLPNGGGFKVILKIIKK